jgi:small subunit ribosomal protein S6
MQTYETLFITNPTLTEDVERKTVDTLSAIVTDGGGTMVANDRMGRRRLAYPIHKHTDGVYVRFLYDSEAAVPKELERRIRLSDNVLRVLTVRLEQKWAVAAKEQAVRDAQARAEAAERERLERAEAENRAQEEAAARLKRIPRPHPRASPRKERNHEERPTRSEGWRPRWPAALPVSPAQVLQVLRAEGGVDRSQGREDSAELHSRARQDPPAANLGHLLQAPAAADAGGQAGPHDRLAAIRGGLTPAGVTP